MSPSKNLKPQTVSARPVKKTAADFLRWYRAQHPGNNQAAEDPITQSDRSENIQNGDKK